MPRRESYTDTYTGAADSEIRKILCGDTDKSRLSGLLLNIIKNELTARQKQIIMLYYFKELDIVEISRRLNVSPQNVSKVMATARKKIYKFIKYYY